MSPNLSETALMCTTADSPSELTADGRTDGRSCGTIWPRSKSAISPLGTAGAAATPTAPLSFALVAGRIIKSGAKIECCQKS